MSLAALREANRRCFGAAVVPHFRFDRARVVVALEADFLGTWLSPVEFARQWTRARRHRRTATRAFHVQFESGLSVTGSNADLRLAVAPSELGTGRGGAARRASPAAPGDARPAAERGRRSAAAPHAGEIDARRRRALGRTAANRWS